MTIRDDVTLVCIVLMGIFGIPCLLVILPAVLQGLGGDWSAAHLLVQRGWHLVALGTGALICLVLIVGAVLE